MAAKTDIESNAMADGGIEHDDSCSEDNRSVHSQQTSSFADSFDFDIQSIVSLSPPNSPLREERRVSFFDEPQYFPATCCLTAQVQADCWYTVEELARFRDIARRTAMYVVVQRNTNLPTMALGPQTRGLETRFCMERQRRKYWSKRFILGATARQWSPEKIAAAARQLHQWAYDLALEEGRRDFARAYHEQQESSKRSHKDDTCNERRVRSRAC